jgi:hypothetical protein
MDGIDVRNAIFYKFSHAMASEYSSFYSSLEINKLLMFPRRPERRNQIYRAVRKIGRGVAK